MRVGYRADSPQVQPRALESIRFGRYPFIPGFRVVVPT